MHTVELLELAVKTAEGMGYGIRHEWLGGSGGGACEFAGRKWIFIDLALNVVEQLDQVCEALKTDPAIYTIALPVALRRQLGIRQSA